MPFWAPTVELKVSVSCLYVLMGSCSLCQTRLTLCPLPPVLFEVPPQASSRDTAALLVSPTATADCQNRPVNIDADLSTRMASGAILWAYQSKRGQVRLLHRFVLL